MPTPHATGIMESARSVTNGPRGAATSEARPGPRFSLRLRIHLGFLAVFLCAMGIGALLAGAVFGSRVVQVLFLFFLLGAAALTAHVVGRRILDSVDRLSACADRAVHQDFPASTVGGRLRDEFTDLSEALGRLVRQLKSREAVLFRFDMLRTLGVLTPGVAHELNNPLNNILLTADMLLEEVETLPETEMREMLGDIVGQADRAKETIRNLLDFARGEDSFMEPLDVKNLLEDTLRLAANQIRLCGMKTELEAAEGLAPVLGNLRELQRAFLNLILNAVDASPKGGRIRVLAMPGKEPGSVHVEVIDFGAGIPERNRDSVFDPFFTTKGDGKGAGLGLSVSRAIISGHGGRILLRSEEEQGSTFTVTLPTTTVPPRVVGREAPPSQGLANSQMDEENR
jgi:two-component system NtrC family sensor kinase